MRANRKYLVAVALLAVLAVVFGLAGTVAPMSELVSPQQSSSDSVTHFTNPPTFDSGWVNITDKLGQSITLTHDLDTREALVDVVGRQSLTDGDHELFFGATTYVRGWNQTYGGAGWDAGESVVETRDGGYALAGYTYSFGAGGYDFWLVKTDADGSMQWNKTYGGAGQDYTYSMVQASDGGYAIAGYTNSYGAGGIDFWLVKTDSAGNTLWNQTYGGASQDYGYSVVQTDDGGYALAGYTNSFGAGVQDFWLVKTDADGNMQWTRAYGGPDSDFARSVVQTNDGGYALAGCTYSYGAGNADLWFVKTGASGTMQWNKTYGGTSADDAMSIIQTGDGGYAIVGRTGSFGAGGYDFWLVKTDSAGNTEWSQTYGGANYDEAISVFQTGERGYALAGYTNSSGAGGYDFWLVKTDHVGNTVWNQTYGGTIEDYAHSVVQTSDGGYAMSGYTNSSGAGGYDFWLVKTDGELGFSMGLSMTDFTNSTITLYRGGADPYWNYVRVRTWIIKEPTWQFGDINQDGVVDVQDLYILSENYGKTFSLLSLTGIIAIAGIQTYKKRKQPK